MKMERLLHIAFLNPCYYTTISSFLTHMEAQKAFYLTPHSLLKKGSEIYIPFCEAGTGLFWKGWEFIF
jgi:hypothetical protein